MRKISFYIALAIVAAVASGCIGYAPVSAPKAPIYAHFKAPLSLNLNNSDLGSKVGKASNKTILGLVSVGDMSIQKAARNGGISIIKHVDYEYENIAFFIYQRTTTIVYGD